MWSSVEGVLWTERVHPGKIAGRRRHFPENTDRPLVVDNQSTRDHHWRYIRGGRGGAAHTLPLVTTISRFGRLGNVRSRGGAGRQGRVSAELGLPASRKGATLDFLLIRPVPRAAGV